MFVPALEREGVDGRGRGGGPDGEWEPLEGILGDEWGRIAVTVWRQSVAAIEVAGTWTLDGRR